MDDAHWEAGTPLSTSRELMLLYCEVELEFESSSMDARS